EFYRRGYFDSNLAKLKQLYAPRLQAIIQALETYLPDVPFARPEGGFFVSVTLPDEKSAHLVARAQQANLVLTDGRAFFAEPLDKEENSERPGENFVRLPFCALTEEQIEEGVKRLAAL
ncbi:MAG: PLP-dependent aminotransferase family protein, partial [Ktedonobacteraceae bacterium]|nr:PLP-dependent aminotransferase family protein [Ktedonobacteraceae bacterium]